MSNAPLVVTAGPPRVGEPAPTSTQAGPVLAVVLTTIAGVLLFVALVLFLSCLYAQCYRRRHAVAPAPDPESGKASPDEAPKKPFKIPVVIIEPNGDLILGARQPSAHLAWGGSEASPTAPLPPSPSRAGFSGMQGWWRCTATAAAAGSAPPSPQAFPGGARRSRVVEVRCEAAAAL